MKTEGLFAATTTIEVYDKLRLLKMRRPLTLDNYLKHVQKFIDTEARSHAKTDPKKVIDIFVHGLQPERLVDRISSVLKSTEKDLSRVVAVGVQQVNNMLAIDRESAILKELTGKKRGCYICGSIEHHARDCPSKEAGKRRTSKDSHKSLATGGTPHGKARFIPHRDPRYKRFFPGVKCTKCGRIGHYPAACQEEGSKQN
ncbi:hypothetical protein ADUPG1_002792, partial [Aduncisulcus paluster]